MRLLLLLLTSFLFLAAACTKADDDTPSTPFDELPPATQVGANTFGCLIDGVPFQNRGGGFSVQDINASYFKPDQSLGIYAIEYLSADGRDRNSISIDIENFSGVGFQNLDTTNPAISFKSSGIETEYRFEPEIDHSINIIHFDSISNIVSGEFYFTAINVDSSTDSVLITNGRFDVIYFE